MHHDGAGRPAASRTAEIAERFGRAADSYDRHAALQRHAAAGLAVRIEAAFAGRPPGRILELACGTGLLSLHLRRLFPRASLVCTDLSAAMLSRCRDRLGAVGAGEGPETVFAVSDLARPAFAGSFDLVCCSLGLQWVPEPGRVPEALMRLLAPNGRLMLATLAAPALEGWKAAHRAEHGVPGTLVLDGLDEAGPVRWERERVLVPHADGLDFLRTLRGLGADRPRDGHRPLPPGRMRRVLRRFEREHGATADWTVAYGQGTRPARRGVFVTGTDTDVGKTVVAAVLSKAWGAEYWKPFQTGLDGDPGDSATVGRLAGIGPDRIHPPLMELRAPLAPAEAARLEGRRYDPAALTLPAARTAGDPVLVVEGAGGLLVPLDDGILLVDEIVRLGLPVVVVARTALGTINHTLLTIEAIRARGLPPPLVILNGSPSASNRAAIERHSGARVVAEFPRLGPGEDLDVLVRRVPAFDVLLGAPFG